MHSGTLGAAPATSPLHADVTRRLTALGVAPEGQEWLIKALHPAAGSECPGTPDQSLAQSVLPDFRTTQVVSFPAGVPWDLLIWVPPGDVVGCIYAAGKAGTDFTVPGPDAPVGTVCKAVFAQPTEPVANTNWSVPGGAPVQFAAQVPSSRPYSWRKRYSGVTAYLTASALNDQGTVFASSFPTGIERDSVDLLQANTPSGFRLPTTSFTTSVPFDEATLVQMSAKPYVGKAKDGAYVPTRFVGPQTTYVTPSFPGDNVVEYGGQFFVPADDQAARTSLPAYLTNLASIVGTAYAPAWPSTAWPRNTTNPVGQPSFDTGYNNLTQTVIIFRGLSGDASVTIKTYFGLEVNPRFDSPTRQFIRPPVRFNPRVMELYHQIAYDLDYCYPASYNSLGTILGTIGNVLKGVLPTVAKFVPVVGPVLSSVLEGVMGGGGGGGAAASVPKVKSAAPPAVVIKASRRGRKKKTTVLRTPSRSASRSSRRSVRIRTPR